MRRSRGGRHGVQTPLKNHKAVGFLSNTGPNPWIITKLPSKHSMLGQHLVGPPLTKLSGSTHVYHFVFRYIRLVQMPKFALISVSACRRISSISTGASISLKACYLPLEHFCHLRQGRFVLYLQSWFCWAMFLLEIWNMWLSIYDLLFMLRDVYMV